MLEIRDVQHNFGEKKVLHDINLQIKQGEFIGFVGSSGSGKSTLLRFILGTHLPKAGEILIGNKPVTKPSRDVGIVYQHYSLYDFLTSEENVAFGLMLDQTSIFERLFMPWKWLPLRKKHIVESKEFLKKVGLERAIGSYPSELSGGMKQRVAIAQALIMKPKLLLLDEPFGALDEATREDLQQMILSLRAEKTYTILFVTHELNEAFYLADRVIGLSQHWTNGDLDGKKLGAKVCFDEQTPLFLPGELMDVGRFSEKKNKLVDLVFGRK